MNNNSVFEHFHSFYINQFNISMVGLIGKAPSHSNIVYSPRFTEKRFWIAVQEVCSIMLFGMQKIGKELIILKHNKWNFMFPIYLFQAINVMKIIYSHESACLKQSKRWKRVLVNLQCSSPDIFLRYYKFNHPYLHHITVHRSRNVAIFFWLLNIRSLFIFSNYYHKRGHPATTIKLMWCMQSPLLSY